MVGSSIYRRLQDTHEVSGPPRSVVDLRDRRAVHAWLQQLHPDIVIHAAGKVGGIEANRRDNAGFLAANLEMGMNVVQVARETGVRRLLNIASSCVYPYTVDSPFKERQLFHGPVEPTNEGYAVAKLAVMKLCELITKDEVDANYVTAIPCNLYGPGDDFDPLRSHMVPGAIRKVVEATESGTDTVEIWGDGRARREFMFVDDLSDFVRVALDRWESVPAVLNVGTGEDFTIDEYYETIADVVGFRGSFFHDPTRPTGVRQKLLDCQRVHEWGWSAETDLKRGLASTLAFFKEQIHD